MPAPLAPARATLSKSCPGSSREGSPNSSLPPGVRHKSIEYTHTQRISNICKSHSCLLYVYLTNIPLCTLRVCNGMNVLCMYTYYVQHLAPRALGPQAVVSETPPNPKMPPSCSNRLCNRWCLRLFLTSWPRSALGNPCLLKHH